MVPFRTHGLAPACDCCGSNSLLYKVLDFYGELNVFGNYLCEPCFRLAGKRYEGSKTLDCVWCGVAFVLFREGGLRREYIESGYMESGRVEVGYCWSCLDAMREDLRRAAQTANSNARRARLLNATPGWADLDAIRAVYEEARRISRETGILHHVDHEVPLNSPFASGFHVAENLQILPAIENLKKSNKLNGVTPGARKPSTKVQRNVDNILEEQLAALCAKAAQGIAQRQAARMKPRLVKAKQS